MSKIDYTKVDKLFDDAMVDYSSENLLFLADIASGFGSLGKRVIPFEKYRNSPKFLFENLRQGLIFIQKNDPELFQNLKIDRKELRQYFKNPDSPTEDELKHIKQILEEVDTYKRDLRKKMQEKISNEELIQNSRKSQPHKRFNIPDDWLPLH